LKAKEAGTLSNTLDEGLKKLFFSMKTINLNLPCPPNFWQPLTSLLFSAVVVYLRLGLVKSMQMLLLYSDTFCKR
jgi:hypothetical protein